MKDPIYFVISLFHGEWNSEEISDTSLVEHKVIKHPKKRYKTTTMAPPNPSAPQNHVIKDFLVPLSWEQPHIVQGTQVTTTVS